MGKILFVCLGNICRSPMAEFVFKDMVKRSGLADKFHIESAATSDEEQGNPVHRGTVQKLKQYKISCAGKTARQMTRDDYNKFDMIIGMDRNNVRDILRIVGKDPKRKVFRFLDLAEKPRDIAGPWYTGNFDATYNDIKEGCEELIMKIVEDELLYDWNQY